MEIKSKSVRQVPTIYFGEQTIEAEPAFPSRKKEILRDTQRNRDWSVSTPRAVPNLSAPMNIEPQHNEAMRKEIAYRLGVLLSREQESTPERLLWLVRQLGQVDHDPAGDTTFGPTPSVESIDIWLRSVFVRQEQHLRERLQSEPDRYERGELERLLVKIVDTLQGDLGSQKRA